MEIKAIVYNSNAGHTAKYAALLSKAIGIPCYNLETAKTKVSKGQKIIFLGWLMAGFVKGYKKAKKRYDVSFAVGVGMTPPSLSEKARLSKQNKISPDKFEMLLGGFDINKLHGVYKFMMTCMVKAIKKGVQNKTDATGDEKLLLDMAVNGGDFVSIENLIPLLGKINN